MTPLPDPHPASAAARVGGVTFCSSILPWNGCGSGHPWDEGTSAERTRRTLSALDQQLPRERVVRGGDFNHSLVGQEVAGTKAGRTAIGEFLADRALVVPTSELRHRLDDVWSIDHIAVPAAWTVRNTTRHDGTWLSDHDAYVVEVDVPPQASTGR